MALRCHRTVCGRLACLGASVAAAAVLAPSAGAASICDVPETQPFLPWVDPANYVLVPGGAIESGSTSWLLARGAAIVPGNEPFQVHGSSDDESLSLPSGSAAVTRLACLQLTDPTLRFFATNTGSPVSMLRVDVFFRSANGTLLGSAVLASLAATADWAPTPTIPVLANGTAPVGTQYVQFRFTPLGGDSGWKIDDVYVDPWISR